MGHPPGNDSEVDETSYETEKRGRDGPTKEGEPRSWQGRRRVTTTVETTSILSVLRDDTRNSYYRPGPRLLTRGFLHPRGISDVSIRGSKFGRRSVEGTTSGTGRGRDSRTVRGWWKRFSSTLDLPDSYSDFHAVSFPHSPHPELVTSVPWDPSSTLTSRPLNHTQIYWSSWSGLDVNPRPVVHPDTRCTGVVLFYTPKIPIHTHINRKTRLPSPCKPTPWESGRQWIGWE